MKILDDTDDFISQILACQLQICSVLPSSISLQSIHLLLHQGSPSGVVGMFISQCLSNVQKYANIRKYAVVSERIICIDHHNIYHIRVSQMPGIPKYFLVPLH